MFLQWRRHVFFFMLCGQEDEVTCNIVTHYGKDNNPGCMMMNVPPKENTDFIGVIVH